MAVCKGRLAGFVLHIFNAIYFLAGVAILVFGIVALCSPSTIVNLMSYIPAINNLSKVVQLTAQGSIYLGPTIYMICLGSVVIILSFLGCSGVFFTRKGVLLVIFGISTLLIMLFNIAVIIFHSVDPYFIENNVKNNMMTALIQNFVPENVTASGEILLPDNEVAAAWITMQYNQTCCGVSSYADYQMFTWDNNITFANGQQFYEAVVPLSCCMLKVPGQVAVNVNEFINYQQCLTTANSYTNLQGCSNYVMQQITRYNFVSVCVAAAFDALQAIIIALSVYVWTVQRSNSITSV